MTDLRALVYAQGFSLRVYPDPRRIQKVDPLSLGFRVQGLGSLRVQVLGLGFPDPPGGSKKQIPSGGSYKVPFSSQGPKLGDLLFRSSRSGQLFVLDQKAHLVQRAGTLYQNYKESPKPCDSDLLSISSRGSGSVKEYDFNHNIIKALQFEIHCLNKEYWAAGRMWRLRCPRTRPTWRFTGLSSKQSDTYLLSGVITNDKILRVQSLYLWPQLLTPQYL